MELDGQESRATSETGVVSNSQESLDRLITDAEAVGSGVRCTCEGNPGLSIQPRLCVLEVPEEIAEAV